jgi:hypothetical protein
VTVGDSAVTGAARALVGEPVPSRPKTTVRRLTLRVWDEQAQCERLQGIGWRWECAGCGDHGKNRDVYGQAAHEARGHRCEPPAAA